MINEETELAFNDTGLLPGMSYGSGRDLIQRKGAKMSDYRIENYVARGKGKTKYQAQENAIEILARQSLAQKCEEIGIIEEKETQHNVKSHDRFTELEIKAQGIIPIK